MRRSAVTSGVSGRVWEREAGTASPSRFNEALPQGVSSSLRPPRALGLCAFFPVFLRGPSTS